MTLSKSYRCIVVEDEVHHQELISFYLKKIGNVEVIGMFADTVNASIQIEKQK